MVFDLASNWGTESDPEVKYHNGNSEPKGFGECKLVGQKHFSLIIFRQSEIQRGLTFLDLKGGLKPKFLRHPVYQSVK